MRTALRVSAVMSVALPTLAIVLLRGSGAIPDTDPRFDAVIVAELFGFLAALVTVLLMVNAVAAGRRSFRVVGVALAGVIGLALVSVASVVWRMIVNQPNGSQILLPDNIGILSSAVVIVVGLLAFISSFRLRAAAAPHATAGA